MPVRNCKASPKKHNHKNSIAVSLKPAAHFVMQCATSLVTERERELCEATLLQCQTSDIARCGQVLNFHDKRNKLGGLFFFNLLKFLDAVSGIL